MNAHALRQAAIKHNALRDELLRRFGDALIDDDQALLDTLEGISDFDQQVLAVLRSADDDDMLIDGIEARVIELNARALRLEARVEQKQAAILDAMQGAAVKKIESPDATLSCRWNPPGVVITDEAALPPEFVRSKITTSPDKKAIKEALDAHKEVKGAILGNGSVSLVVRRG